MDQSYFIPPYLYGVIELYQATPHASNKFCTKALQFNQDKISMPIIKHHLTAWVQNTWLPRYAKLYAENSLISPRSSGFFGPHPNQYIQCVMICTVQKRKIDRPCPAARSKMIFKIFRSIFTCTLYYCKAQCCGKKSLKVYIKGLCSKSKWLQTFGHMAREISCCGIFGKFLPTISSFFSPQYIDLDIHKTTARLCTSVQ